MLYTEPILIRRPFQSTIKDADLEMLDLNTGLPVDIGVLNSRFCDSYHVRSAFRAAALLSVAGEWIICINIPILLILTVMVKRVNLLFFLSVF
ncbi:MAG: hypothetical protein V8S95_10400 [Odoribacter sp.]